MGNKLLASIDIGTNTFRLLIAEVHFNAAKTGYTINEMYSERVITRLGDGISENGRLSGQSIHKSIEVLKRFSELTSQYNVLKTSAVATSALREADNSKDFLIRAKSEADIDIHVISGEHEARITASGMLMDFEIQSPALLLDIGGGSTELMLLRPSDTEYRTTDLKYPDLDPFAVSMNMGVVYLANRYMKQDPPPENVLNSMRDDILLRISTIKESFDHALTDDTILLGTAGTVTALAAICQGLTDFDHSKIHKYNLSLDNVQRIYKKISTISSDERARLIPFDLARLDIIVPGTLILLTLMKSFDFSKLVVSDHGLREGILIELFNQLS